MPSPTSALSFATKASASASATTPIAANDDASGAKKPAFDDMVRRPAKRDDAPRTPHARADSPARKQDDTTRAASDDDKREDVAAATVPPVPVELPPPFATLATDATTAVPTDPLGNPLVGGAQPAANTATPDALLAAGRAALPNIAGAMPATPGVASPDAGDTALTDTSPALQAPAANETKAPLQNLLSFATHLATGQVAAAVPDAVNLGRDIIDAFRSEDGDATPTTNMLAGVGASNGPLGLSRTETVNAMEAPSADLQGGHFDEDIGDAVRWMADQKIGHAHIKVTPNDLGTVEIRLRLEGDRVHADFASAQADVRQALESSLPRLRDMLGQHGFQLAHADVGQQHAPPSQGAGSRPGEGTGDAGEPATEAPRTVRMTARGLVDAYA